MYKLLIKSFTHLSLALSSLTHWGRVTHKCVGKLTIIGSDNGLSPERRQAIIWTNAGILLIEPLGTNFIEIVNGIQTFSFKKMHLKMSSAKWRPFCLGLNVLKYVLHFPSIYCRITGAFDNQLINQELTRLYGPIRVEPVTGTCNYMTGSGRWKYALQEECQIIDFKTWISISSWFTWIYIRIHRRCI